MAGSQTARLELLQHLLADTDLVQLPNQRRENILLFLVQTVGRQQLEQRQSQGVPRADDIELEEEVTAHVDAVRAHWPASSEKQSALVKATDDDPTLRKIIGYIMDGWPRHSSIVGEDAAPYYSMKAELSVSNGLVILFTLLKLCNECCLYC